MCLTLPTLSRFSDSFKKLGKSSIADKSSSLVEFKTFSWQYRKETFQESEQSVESLAIPLGEHRFSYLVEGEDLVH